MDQSEVKDRERNQKVPKCRLEWRGIGWSGGMESMDGQGVETKMERGNGL